MAAYGRIEQAERTMFQLLLQQIAVVLEVPKIGFKICLTFFLKDSNFWYFLCFVKLQVRLYKAYHEPLFIVRIKDFFQCSTHMLPENIRKPLAFYIFAGIGGFK